MSTTARLGTGWRLGELAARPGQPSKDRLTPGTHEFGTGLLHVPADLPDGPVPLVVLLHGAGSNPERALTLTRDRTAVVYAPKSRARTWDAIHGNFGPDVEALDRALAELFEHFDVKTAAIVGFSDGASYALSLGLVNGTLFEDVVAFSPGFVAPGARAGRPKVFVSHGRHDGVLPIENTSRMIVPALRIVGYRVDYREFTGGHEVPTTVADAAFRRIL
ncbi:alpha/beta hydrolase [Kutzneria sp. NPDC052558]|uniref:alpha/beta hydrolase n=1 Tax=Kutzneria sp. NPDC052558 TaxID=3364121 RepID=UPI0037C8276C